MENLGSVLVATEYPHQRSWGTVIGVLQVPDCHSLVSLANLRPFLLPLLAFPVLSFTLFLNLF